MSFILDALKKSENERQRQVGPSLADVPVGKRRNDKPWWAVAVAALLVVNLGVLLVVLTRNGDAKSDTPQPTQSVPTTAAVAQPAPPIRTQQYAGTPIPETTAEEPSSPPARRSAPPNLAVRSLADEAGAYEATDPNVARNPHLAAAAAVPEGPPMVRPIEAPSVAPAPTRPAGASPATQHNASGNDEVLPTLSDVTASGTTLPDLHLDIHVSSANAAERFVFVNMRKYTEGQALNEGPTVEKITAEGVILNHHGLRFLLPRQ
jgi:general secretion pathway protein B